ncbi:hypothetical protein [Acidianus sp. RZ1]|uniref:hypothetical protein n=1 Tax=Acidianus sp. RZ1 TaxID=1540082 RepID=UPI0014928020|nr:hypothetical protein [Acidianus sp. RZ1]NON62236.1 hypothetical protein [Acidianus sp. RZ1]
MQQGLEAEFPICFSGIPLKVNNPIFIVMTKGIISFSEINQDIWGISQYFKDATGFSPTTFYTINGEIPLSSKYILSTEMTLKEMMRKLGINISKEEFFQILNLIDEVAFDSEVIRGMRKSMEANSSLLYRDLEDPVLVKFPVLNIKALMSYPLGDPVYKDNALIHLTGYLPSAIAEGKTFLISVENGLWGSLYSLPILNVKNWKWIWDLNYSTLISFNLDESDNL